MSTTTLGTKAKRGKFLGVSSLLSTQSYPCLCHTATTPCSTGGSIKAAYFFCRRTCVLQCGQHRQLLHRQDVIRSAVSSTATQKNALYTLRPCRMVTIWNVVWVGLPDIICISCVSSVYHGEWCLHIHHYATISTSTSLFLCKSFHQFAFIHLPSKLEKFGKWQQC
jgi:hypothetical protein